MRTLESFHTEHVMPSLKKNIEWRITDTASNVINDLLASKLEVRVSAREFELPSKEKPVGLYYSPTIYKDVNTDKSLVTLKRMPVAGSTQEKENVVSHP